MAPERTPEDGSASSHAYTLYNTRETTLKLLSPLLANITRCVSPATSVAGTFIARTAAAAHAVESGEKVTMASDELSISRVGSITRPRPSQQKPVATRQWSRGARLWRTARKATSEWPSSLDEYTDDELREELASRRRARLHGARALPLEVLRAAGRGELETVQRWLKSGGHADARCPAAAPAPTMLLTMAALCGRLEMVRAALHHGASVNLRDDKGSNALMDAAAMGHTHVVQLLLRHFAKLDLQDSEADATALMLAAWKGHAECVRVLLDAGADVMVRHAEGLTAFELAELNGQSSVIALLRPARSASAEAAAPLDVGVQCCLLSGAPLMRADSNRSEFLAMRRESLTGDKDRPCRRVSRRESIGEPPSAPVFDEGAKPDEPVPSPSPALPSEQGEGRPVVSWPKAEIMAYSRLTRRARI